MKPFRFVILGAANIASKFCDAVSRIENCEAAAVASKSVERARAFAEKNGLAAYYGSYEEMLDAEKPDCAYIAVTPHDHHRLSMLCLEKNVPVICEKAMFQNSAEARGVFELSEKKGIFVMEALWSRFLPAVKQAKAWLQSGEIGRAETSQFTIGFRAPEGAENRYNNPALGGGAAKDITVYAYEITDFVLEQPVKRIYADAVWSDTGVDLTDQVSIQYEHTMAQILTTFACPVEERMVICGGNGRIVLPTPHYASECFLYGADGTLREHFVDKETENGFTYEIEEVIRCVRDNKVESPVVPHRVTLACAELFDRIEAARERN